MKKIVVLGGGIGGVTVSEELRKKLGREHEITVVDGSDKHYYQPAFLGIMTGRVDPSSTYKNLSHISRKNIKFINEEVREVDPEAKTVTTVSQKLNFDYLVVSLGAQLASEKVPGLADTGFTPYSYQSAIKLNEIINVVDHGKIAILVSSMPYKCPAAPYETAFLLDSMFRKKRVRQNISLSVFTAEGQPMPTAGPDLGQKIQQLLSQREIEFNPLLNIVSIDKLKNTMVFDNERREQFDLLVYVPPHKVPDPIVGSALAGEAGWIPVDPKNLRTKFDGVYAIGDVASIKLPGNYKPNMPLSLPKAGVFAHEQGKIVAGGIADDIQGKTGGKPFDGHGSCFLETGEGKAAFSKGDFFASPQPKIEFNAPSRFLRFQKILFEKYWLWTKP